MKYKQLCKMPLLAPPDNFPQAKSTITEKYDGKPYVYNIDQYNYQAEIIDKMLVITVYLGEVFQYRIFQQENDWVNQRADSNNPSTAMTGNIIGYYGNRTYSPMNNADETIYNWLKKVWWEIRDYKRSTEWGRYNYSNGLALLGCYQQHLRKIALEEKHNRIRREIDNAMLEIKEVSKDFIKFCDRVSLKKSAYIFYENSGNTYTGECSYCHHEVSGPKAKHRQTGKCPHCHNKVTFISANRWKNMNHFTDRSEAAYLQITKDGYCVRAFKTEKVYYPKDYYKRSVDCYSKKLEYEGKYFNSYITIDESERNFCNYKGYCRKSFTWGDFMQTGNYRWCNNCCSSGWDMWVYPKTLDKIVKQIPEIKYVPLKSIVRADKQNPMRIIKNAIRYPFVEYCWKMGLKNIANSILNRGSYYKDSVLNLDGKNIFEVLQIDKRDLKPLIKLDISFSQLDTYHTIKAKSPVIDWDIYSWVLKNEIYLKDVEKIQEVTTLLKAKNYFEKQFKLKTDCDNVYSNIRDVIGDWKDYIDECEELKYNLSDTVVLFPKNLQEAHQETIKLTALFENEKRIKKCKKQFDERSKALKSFSFKDKQFIIRAVTTPEELISEGAVLSHCVGQHKYMEHHAEGKTNIFLIREIDKPDIPFYTLELSTGFRIVQTRGYKNKSTTDELKAFLKKWETKLKTIKNKQERIRVTA